MSKQIRVGLVGLGGIAQKAYLPILTKETDWELVGAFTPNAEKRERICAQYRIESYSSLEKLSQVCDAIFVHSSTDSHFEIVSYLLSNGIDVYVDKPLAGTIEEAERLMELSEKKQRKLMVGFNRRFAPMYSRVKELAGSFDCIQIEKHRFSNVGPQDFATTMLDDYLHLVDTIRWFATDKIMIANSFTKVNSDKQLVFANHGFETKDSVLHTSMHRQAGSNLEKLEVLTNGSIIRVENMNKLEIEENQFITTTTPGSWEQILKTRGFVDCVEHFITCVKNDLEPASNGYEALQSQILLQELIDNVKS